jgi:hypothetical protein
MKSATVYIFPIPKKEHEWEVIRLRSKGEFLGRITAPDENAARQAITKLLGLQPWDEKRLIVRRAA